MNCIKGALPILMQPLARSSFWMSDAGPCDSKVHFLRLFRSPSGFMKHFKWHSVYFNRASVQNKNNWYKTCLFLMFIWIASEPMVLSNSHLKSFRPGETRYVNIQEIIFNFITLLFVPFLVMAAEKNAPYNWFLQNCK